MIRAAVVGLGWWGRTLVRETAGSDAIRIVLGVEPAEAARLAAAGDGIEVVSRFEDALARDDIDAVVLCSPHRFHADQIEAAARAGKHVFCEKPLCPTGAEAARALAAVRDAGLTIGIGHERRFEPAVLDLRRRFAAGEFGDAVLMEGNFSQDKFLALPADNWRLSPDLAPVGPLSATGIHLVDLAIALFGAPTDVLARLSVHTPHLRNGDALTISLGFAGGRTAQISAILTTPFVGRLALYGTAGWIEIRDRTHPENPTGWDVVSARRGETATTAFWPPHRAVRDNLDAFARAASGGSAYPVSPEEMLLNARTFEAIVRSARSGRIETI
ncbi:MAG: Gfo/Idh/MocA family oxidoreductase [Hyphomicrobiales bacterium]|nr:Gfo/Idh/MocA family oxidoreductase [Hyphomicrobiales bacterium]